MSGSVSKFRTSREAEDAFRTLHKKVNLPFNLLCRLAWSKSLTIEEPVDVSHLEITGKEFNRYSVTGEYDDLIKALTTEHAGIKLSDEEFFGSYFKAHVDRGILLLQNELLETESIDAFWANLLRGLPSPVDSSRQAPSGATTIVNVIVGEEVGTGEPVICSLNTATNPHMAVVGIPGSGKTQFILKI